jgi:hypothetical protein
MHREVVEILDDNGGRTYYFDFYGSYTFGIGVYQPTDLTVQEFEANIEGEGDMEAQFPVLCRV